MTQDERENADKMYREGLSIYKISEIISYSPGHIYRELQKFGTKFRPKQPRKPIVCLCSETERKWGCAYCQTNN